MAFEATAGQSRPNHVAEPAIAAHHVSSGYGGAEVLHDVSLEVAKGEVLAVVGKNGMGKSTLLKTIMGIVRPMSGRVAIQGADVRSKRPFKVARMGVAYIPQERALFSDLTVQENITLALPKGQPLESALERIGELFPKLARRREQKAGTLSGGEQKMLLLARGLTAQPDILLVDEITEGVQPSVRATLREALEHERQERGTTILLVEQDLSFAFALADRYAVLKLGAVSTFGATAEKEWVDVANEHLTM